MGNYYTDQVDKDDEIDLVRAELADAKDDYLRVHKDKMDLFEQLTAARQDVERMRTALTIIADWDHAPITGEEWRESLLDIIRSICDCARAALQGATGTPKPET